MKRLSAVLVGIVLLSFCLAKAEKTANTGMGNEQKNGEQSAKTGMISAGEQKAIDYLVKTFNVSEQTIIDLRNKDYGFGEIAVALVISQKSGQLLSDIIALRDSGMGWGKIAQKYGFKLGPIMKEAEKVKNVFRKDISKKDMNEKPAKPEKHEKQEKMQKPEKAEKPAMPERMEKPEKPQNPAKPY